MECFLACFNCRRVFQPVICDRNKYGKISSKRENIIFEMNGQVLKRNKLVSFPAKKYCAPEMIAPLLIVALFFSKLLIKPQAQNDKVSKVSNMESETISQELGLSGVNKISITVKKITLFK